MSQLTTNTTTIDECIALANSLPDAGSGGGESFITNKLNGAEVRTDDAPSGSDHVINLYQSSKPIGFVSLIAATGYLMQNGRYYSPTTDLATRIILSGRGTATIDENGQIVYDLFESVGYASGRLVPTILSDNTVNLVYTVATDNAFASDYGALYFHIIFVSTSGEIDYDSFMFIGDIWSCYLKGTLITLADGTRIPVENVTYDTELLVWDFDNGCFAATKPVWIKKPQIAPYYYHCTFENGLTLDLVGSNGNCHAVYNADDNCFEYANNCVGKNVMTELGVSKLVSCDRVDEEVEFYNIATNYHINCYAGQVLTSTKLNNLYPIEDMKFIKEDRELIPIEEFDSIPEKYYYGFRLGENKRENLDNVLKNIKAKVAVAQEAESDE